MQTKPLLFGLIGFLLGGLVASLGSTLAPKPNDSATPEMTMSQMSQALAGKTGDDFDQLFLASMIEHHQGAIDMANAAKANAKHNEIKHMAGDIIATQSKEIDLMRSWQGDWGYQTTSSGPDKMGH